MMLVPAVVFWSALEVGVAELVLRSGYAVGVGTEEVMYSDEERVEEILEERLWSADFVALGVCAVRE